MMISLERDTRRTLKPTVFVVDDDARVRDSLELLIREEGWRPKTFASAKAFLVQSSVAIEWPHLPVIFLAISIITDLHLQPMLHRFPARIKEVRVSPF
jgi:FixJ family two-component response regulator